MALMAKARQVEVGKLWKFGGSDTGGLYRYTLASVNLIGIIAVHIFAV